MEERLLRDRDCYQMLNISRTLFWLRVKDGSLPPGFMLTEKTRRWKLSEMQALIEERSQEG